MRTLGIDLGSRAVKIAVMEDGKIVYRQAIGTMCFYRDYCRRAGDGSGRLQADFSKLPVGQPDASVSTGYGRNNTDLAGFQSINECKAHVYGAFYQTGLRDFILLDVGGQDVKIVKVENGIITDLMLNDKCAASCGRYLENMAAVLEIPLEELSRYEKDPVDINATCAVFSESSLIGLIAQGVPTERLCAGVNYSLYKRLQPLIHQFGGRRLILSGGVARNRAVAHYLQKDYEEVIVLEEPQFNGAFGCCRYAYKKTQKNKGALQ